MLHQRPPRWQPTSGRVPEKCLFQLFFRFCTGSLPASAQEN